MELRYRVAALLLAAALTAGCGGAAPESGGAKTSTPAAPAQGQAGSANPDTPVSSAPAPEPAPQAQPQPSVTAPTPPSATAPSTPSAPGATPPTGALPAKGTAHAVVPAPVQALSFETMQKGAYSGVTVRKAVLMTDEAAWKANWQQLSARQVPAPEAPALDFSQQSVLAVYMGEQRTGGYAIEITGAELTNGTLRVTVKQTRPGPGSMVTQALTQPYHVVRLPKLPAGTKVEVNW